MISSIEKKTILSVALVLGLFLVIGIAQYRTIQSLIASLGWVTHTVEVLEQLATLEYAVTRSEEAARRYATDREDAALQSYHAAVEQEESSLAQLTRLTVDNINAQQRIQALTPLLNARLESLDQLIASRRTAGADSTPQPDPTQVREIHRLIREMTDDEHRLLQQRRAHAEQEQQGTTAVIIVGSLSAVLIVVWGSVLLHSDLARRQRVEQALRSSEEKFRALAETANDGIVSGDRHSRIVFWNQGAERIFGYPAGEAMGQPLHVLVPERFRTAYQQGLDYYLASAGKQILPHTAELVGRRKDGSEFPIDISFGTWPAGGEVFLTVLIRDISERKQAEDSLRELSGRVLRLQDEERSHLARELHDGTSQTLSAMQLHVALLQSLPVADDASAQESMAELATLVERASSEIRTLSHLLHPPLLEHAGLGDAIRWYVEGFGKRSGIQVETNIDENLPRFSAEIERAVFRIAQETLANVHRHSGSNTAQIHLARADGRINLEISDQGRGIPPEVLQSPSRMGVGIRGMRERVRLLGGELSIESDERGTTIRAQLPAETAPAS